MGTGKIANFLDDVLVSVAYFGLDVAWVLNARLWVPADKRGHHRKSE